MIVVHRARADHAGIGQAQHIHRPFRIVIQPGGVTRLGKRDRLHLSRIGVRPHIDMIEPAQPPFGDIKIAEQADIGEIEIIRPGNHCGPFARCGERRCRQPEIFVCIVGVNVERAVAFIDVILHTFLPRLDQQRFRQRIICGNQPGFARFMIARGNDQPFLVRRQPAAHAETLVVFVVQFDVIGQRLAQPM